MLQKLWIFGLLGLLLVPAAAFGERTLEISFLPTGDPQIAVWLETADGEYVETLMVTRLTATFGLGNRPGRPDFGGGYLWPYGRREMILPIWAHRRNVKYDRIVMQDCKEAWLGWHELTSSFEPFYCRPMTPAEMSVDTITCPTVNFRTDKGVPLRYIDKTRSTHCNELVKNNSVTSLYPPRNDVSQYDAARDWSGVLQLSQFNDLDAVSQATPPANRIFKVIYQLPEALAFGDYIVWVEVNQQYDTNASHSYEFFVDPALPDYGIPALGQPSVVWNVPITLADENQTASSNDYSGYGSIDGTDGTVRRPDQTITANIEGSGSTRLKHFDSNSETVQVRANFVPDATCPNPPPVAEFRQLGGDFDFAEFSFVSTASSTSQISRYEVRYSTQAIKTENNYMDAVPGPALLAMQPMESVSFRLDQLQPYTTYHVAVKSFNSCQQASGFVTTTVTTKIREFATVDACFVATAAYGDINDDSVVVLRRFRDQHLMTNSPGRQLVKAYYQLSPPLAEFIRERPSIRKLTRWSLTPIVETARLFE